jgi:hypothetical protein
MARDSKDTKDDAEAAEKPKAKDEPKAPKGAAVRAELQNLKDRVDAHQPDEIAKSFARLDALLADA